MKLAPGVYMIKHAYVNSYILVSEADEGVILVDTGMPGAEEVILNRLRELGYQPGDVTHIVVTHADIDHMGSLRALKQTTGALVVAHPADAPIITGEQPLRTPQVRGCLGSLARLLWPLVGRLYPAYHPTAVDLLVQDGDRLPGGWQVVHLPGHTAGSIGLYHPQNQVALVGDAVNHRRGRLGPPPALFTADPAQALASMHRLAQLDIEVCGFGHGPPLLEGAGEAIRAGTPSTMI